MSVFLRRDKLCVCVEGSGRVFEKGQTMCLCLCGWGDCVFQKGNIYVSMSLRRDKLCVYVCDCVDGVIMSFGKETNYVSVSVW